MKYIAYNELYFRRVYYLTQSFQYLLKKIHGAQDGLQTMIFVFSLVTFIEFEKCKSDILSLGNRLDK